MKILVAVDGSKSSLNAVKFTAELSKNLRSEDLIMLITVHDDQGLNAAKKYVGDSTVQDYLRELSDAQLKSALTFLTKADIKHNAIIQTGHVAETICKVADKEFDLVVLGAKGRSGIADLLIGSVSQRVLTRCKKPVVLIK